MTTRSLEQQFTQATCARIHKLIKNCETITYPDGASRYYASELRMTLKAGCLLASLSLATTLLEISVRGLIIKYARSANPKHMGLQKELEEKKHLNFKTLLDNLVQVKLFDENDAKQAIDIYNKVRIPIHHGLSRRFLAFHEDDWWQNFRELLYQGEPVNLHDLEKIIEVNALDYIEAILNILEHNVEYS